MEIVKMTALEEKIMCRAYINEDRIKDGKLYTHQVKDLEKVRCILSYMNEKYPDRDFEYFVFEPSSKLSAFTKVEYYDKTSGDDQCTFYTYLHEKENGTFYCEDNFYGFLLRGRYDAWIEEEVKKQLGCTCFAYTTFPTCQGKEISGKESVAEIKEFLYDPYRTTRIYLQADEKKATSCIEQLKKFKNENKLPGHMEIMYHPEIFSLGETGETLFHAPCGANGAKILIIE